MELTQIEEEERVAQTLAETHSILTPIPVPNYTITRA